MNYFYCILLLVDMVRCSINNTKCSFTYLHNVMEFLFETAWIKDIMEWRLFRNLAATLLYKCGGYNWRAIEINVQILSVISACLNWYQALIKLWLTWFNFWLFKNKIKLLFFIHFHFWKLICLSYLFVFFMQ